jgi:PAS domain S-box-containing protein
VTPESFLQFAGPMPEAMILVSGGGFVLALNQACEERLGVDTHAWRGKMLADMVVDPPEETARYLQLCSRSRQAVIGAITVRGRGEIVCRAQGSAVSPKTAASDAVIMLRLVPKEAAAGQFLSLNLRIEELAREIRRRKHAEQLAIENAERLRATLASIGDGVITTDIDGRITNMNAVAESMTGWTADEASGMSSTRVFDIVNETTRQPVENPVRRALREGPVVGLANHTALIAKDGTTRPIDDSAAPIRSADGAIVGCVLVFRDVTERRRSEQRLDEALRFYRSSIDALTGHIAVLDENGVILEVNHAWRHFAEMNHFAGFNCAVGMNYLEVCDTSEGECADDGSVASGIRDVLAGRVAVYEFEYPCHSPTEERWFLMRASRFKSPGPVRVVVSHDDVTQRRAAEEQLRASHVRLFGILQLSPAGIVQADAAGRMTLVNDRWCQMLGYSEAELMGKTIIEVTHPKSVAATVDAVARLAAGGADVQILKTYCRKDGSSLSAQSSVTAVRSPQGEYEGLIAVVLDITERLRIEEELHRVAAELSEADRRKNEFLATLAHELRNPLAPIRNGLEIIRLDGSNLDTVGRVCKLIERQLNQMVRLVDDLMDVSRISTGRVQLRKERVTLASVVQSAIETSRPLIEEMGHVLTVSLPGHPLNIEVDPTRLAQVLMNLLNNAAKYSERNGRIWLTAAQHGSEVAVSVKDAGIGIPPDQLARVFDMFAQLDRSLEKSRGGLGIGLCLVKRIVELHGGRVEAHSQGLGMGSEFIVWLPAVVDSPALQGSAEQRSEDKTARRILVVDDSRDIADSLAMMLRMLGNETCTAYDGEEAVAAADRFRPDVVVLDIGLPGLNGYEACRRIRGLEQGQSMVIIAQTGWGQDADRQRTYEAGFDYHFVKPVDPEALMKLLRSKPKLGTERQGVDAGEVGSGGSPEGTADPQRAMTGKIL